MVRNLATGEETALPAAGDLARRPAWLPDGRWIVYNVAPTAARRDQVERIAADGSGEPVVLFLGTSTRAGSSRCTRLTEPESSSVAWALKAAPTTTPV